MKVGVLGYQGVGKSTVFAALTGIELDTVPGARRRGIAEVVDGRLDHLRRVFDPRKFTRARFDIEELLPIPSSQTKGRGEILAALREPDALLLVIGCFEQARLILDVSLQDPAAQLRSLRDDLLLLDMEVVEQRIGRIDDQMKRGAGDKVQLSRERAILEKILADLESDDGPSAVTDHDHKRSLAELRLFATKPTVVVFNVDEDTAPTSVEAVALVELADQSAVMCAPVEYEISRMDGEDRDVFLDEFGLEAAAAERLTRLAYEALDLISFFTVGEDEVRAWPIRRGSDAVTAAGKIHTDLARGFIRAEVTPYAPVAVASNAREFKDLGGAELKGKDYTVQDGDSLNIRFSV
jgi:GTP-binding protein YchF